MPREKNTLLRFLVPVLTAAVGLGIAWAVFRGGKPTTTPPTGTTTPAALSDTASNPGAKPATDSNATAQQPNGQAGAGGQPSDQPSGQATAPKVDQPAVQTPAPIVGQVAPTGFQLQARVFPGTTLGSLGSLDKASKFQSLLQFSATGAGVNTLDLTNHFNTIKDEVHVRVQSQQTLLVGTNETVLSPFAALAIEVTPSGGVPQFVALAGGPTALVWKQQDGKAAGAFEAIIEDAAGAPVLRIIREYTQEPGSHDVHLRQVVENLSSYALTVRWFQVGPTDLPQDAATYGGDKRRLRFGYLLPAESEPTRAMVVSNAFVTERSTALGEREQLFGQDGSQLKDVNGNAIKGFKDASLWPNETSIKERMDLVWLGMTNRYYGVSVHPLAALDAKGEAKSLRWVESVKRVVLDAGPGHEVLASRLESRPIALSPAGSLSSTADMSMGIFAGPLSRQAINAEAPLSSLGMAGLVVYNFGGPCGFCTFSFITGFLIWLLRVLHDNVFFDWTLAIIFLVVIVRSLLHPVTRWSQIRMARFGKQMGAIGPKQKALQEKYSSDPSKLQQETAKLWREEGINPAGMLGCLPAFLQTPVWIALYATLYFAVELRHQHGFYGLFQAIQPQTSPFWWFLGDLSEPDRLYYFGKTIVTVPMLGPISSINILPIILGIVFFIQQKYLTPPATTTMTPEQELQQKMVKWMMVIMFPLFMYNAPSGLAVYFIANSTLGILESKWIRSHMDKHGLLDLDKMKAEREARRKASGGKQSEGFLARVQRIAADRQKEMEKNRKRKPER